PPSKTWDELVQRTEIIYEEARQTRLGTEKFMLDGRHTGTGGGNHIVLGAERAPDSPFLRRPCRLKSLVAFWQNHPSLSYLFSGMFIGPTSQAPRIDEARLDSLYEMELAFAEGPPRSRARVAPVLGDRSLPHLVHGGKGNKAPPENWLHKLLLPGRPTGRLGLVEFR